VVDRVYHLGPRLPQDRGEAGRAWGSDRAHQPVGSTTGLYAGVMLPFAVRKFLYKGCQRVGNENGRMCLLPHHSRPGQGNNPLRRRSVCRFRDVHPQAPVHFSSSPQAHHLAQRRLSGEELLLGQPAAGGLAPCQRERNRRTGFRAVINTNAEPGDRISPSVHILGGRIMRWPPG